MQCSRLGTPAVNHIYYVHLRWGYVFRGVAGLVVGEYEVVMEVLSTRAFCAAVRNLLVMETTYYRYMYL